MIKVDLITGFLGSGKTTFLKKYARFLMNQGEKIGILENDYGAVNVDMLLLQELRGESCELEMVAGGCDEDCHRRRFKTKLISMAMSGYQRVIIEPSGIFDMDEFFDALREEPLDNWYEIGSVITIMDATHSDNLSEQERYILASQLAFSGCILPSRLDVATAEDIRRSTSLLEQITEEMHCRRPLPDMTIWKKLEDLTDDDFAHISSCGYQLSDFTKKISFGEAGYSTVYFLEPGLSLSEIRERIPLLFSREDFGHVFRIKGFCLDDNQKWVQINAAKESTSIEAIPTGQDVLIVIGHNLNKACIEEYMQTNTSKEI